MKSVELETKILIPLGELPIQLSFLRQCDYSPKLLSEKNPSSYKDWRKVTDLYNPAYQYDRRRKTFLAFRNDETIGEWNNKENFGWVKNCLLEIEKLTDSTTTKDKRDSLVFLSEKIFYKYFSKYRSFLPCSSFLSFWVTRKKDVDSIALFNGWVINYEKTGTENTFIIGYIID